MIRTKNWLLYILLNGLLAFPIFAVADQPDICLTLTPETSSGPGVKLTVFASNKPGSVSTFYGLNGSGSSTQGTKELFYLLSGTGYVTTRNAIETSLTGTAVDSGCDCTSTHGASVCECVREATFHVVVDGQNDRYTQIVRTPAEQSEVIFKGAAAFSQGNCGKKK
jgi:hypothetical protein